MPQYPPKLWLITPNDQRLISVRLVSGKQTLMTPVVCEANVITTTLRKQLLWYGAGVSTLPLCLPPPSSALWTTKPPLFLQKVLSWVKEFLRWIQAVFQTLESGTA
jgi:hypothetical protein